MNNLQIHIKNYLEYCRVQKRLDEKTRKAYRIDLRQFTEQISVTEISHMRSSCYRCAGSILFRAPKRNLLMRLFLCKQHRELLI